MIKLHGFGPNLGLPDPSPFVLKLDAYLRMSGIPFERADGIDNIQKAPKGKLPYISDGEQIIADSSFVVQHLAQKYSIDLDGHLSDEQRAVAYMLRSTLEEKLYWCSLYFRWIDDAGWVKLKPMFFSSLPMPLRIFVPTLVRRGIKKASVNQGTARHSPEQIIAISREGLSHVSRLIGESPFLFGDKPCTEDATVFAFLAQTTLAEFDNPINTMTQEFPNLKRYCEHFRNVYYHDQ